MPVAWSIACELLDGIGLCERNMELLSEELAHVDAQLRRRTEHIEAIQRLITIPGVGDIVATTLYACIGDVSRFPNAKSLAAYVGLVPSVRQSADTNVLGRITKQGAPQIGRPAFSQGNMCRRPHGFEHAWKDGGSWAPIFPTSTA